MVSHFFDRTINNDFPWAKQKVCPRPDRSDDGRAKTIVPSGPQRSVGDSSTIGVIKEKKDGLDKSIAYFDMVWASLIELFKLKII